MKAWVFIHEGSVQMSVNIIQSSAASVECCWCTVLLRVLHPVWDVVSHFSLRRYSTVAFT